MRSKKGISPLQKGFLKREDISKGHEEEAEKTSLEIYKMQELNAANEKVKSLVLKLNTANAKGLSLGKALREASILCEEHIDHVSSSFRRSGQVEGQLLSMVKAYISVLHSRFRMGLALLLERNLNLEVEA